jgi:hypothetical protein
MSDELNSRPFRWLSFLTWGVVVVTNGIRF